MKKVLIIDDEALAIQYLSGILNWNEQGYENPLTAVTMHKAIDLYRTHRPDIVIVDIRMPEISGLDLISKMRAINTECGFIVLTAYKDFEVLQKALHIGVSEFLIKHEITPQILNAALSKTMESVEQKRKVIRKAVSRWLFECSRGQSEEPLEIQIGEMEWQLALIPDLQAHDAAFYTDHHIFAESRLSEMTLCLLSLPNDEPYDLMQLTSGNDRLLYSERVKSISQLSIPKWLAEIHTIPMHTFTSFDTYHAAADKDYAAQAVAIISTEYGKPLSTELIAERLFISEGYLRSVFKKAYNCSVSEYLRKCRIEAACKMLESGNKKVFEIAEACGYGNSQHFSQVFRQEKGTTPHAYAERSRRK